MPEVRGAYRSKASARRALLGLHRIQDEGLRHMGGYLMGPNHRHVPVRHVEEGALRAGWVLVGWSSAFHFAAEVGTETYRDRS